MLGWAIYLAACALIGPALYKRLASGNPHTKTRNLVLTIPATAIIAAAALFAVAVVLHVTL